jgi:hypothetical protein
MSNGNKALALTIIKENKFYVLERSAKKNIWTKTRKVIGVMDKNA